MNSADFELYATLLRETSGLVITPEKGYLLESRLLPVAKKNGWNGLDDITAKLKEPVRDQNLVKDIREAMTTNESSFFRDQKPFDMLRDVVIPHLIAKKGADAKIRIWSAACSSGQEPYSIAMMIKETPAFANLQFEIVATDISRDILDQAEKGEYSQFEVQRGLPIMMLMKYFEQLSDQKWKLKPEISDLITFKYLNLLEDFSSLGKFDIIFCRNVLIYFDAVVKGQVLERMDKILNKSGFLFLGGAETVLGITDVMVPLQGHRGLYVSSSGDPADYPQAESAPTQQATSGS